jgi:type IV pilus assembly protein PilC
MSGKRCKRLRGKGLTVISLKMVGEGANIPFASMFNRVSGNDLVQFTQQLATMLNSGLPLTDALDLFQSQSRPSMSKVLGEIAHDIQGGSSLGDALARHGKIFSSVYVALVRAGEAAGKLDEVLNRLAENEEKSREFRSKTKSALIYPAIVVVAMTGVIAVLMIFVIPQMTEMYESFGAELPFATVLLIWISNLFRTLWWLVLILGAAGMYFLGQWRKTATGGRKIDELLLKVPVFGPLRVKIILTEFARTLSLLVGAGISILEALQIVSQAMENIVFEDAVKKAAKGVEKGLPLAAMLARQQVFPPIMSQMVAVGEETGELDVILGKVAKYFEMEAEALIKNLTTAIEPIIMIVLGVVVGFIVFAIITPIYKITELF